MEQRSQGQCLCGAVMLTGQGMPKITICHCEQCRRWSGGIAIGVIFADGLSVEGLDQVQWYASSDWAERGFCKVCGANLLYRLKAAPDTYYPHAGAFILSDSTVIDQHIFIDSKPQYYDFADDAPRLTGAETFARYQNQQDADQ